MRYLIDTNILVFLILDKGMIHSNVGQLFDDYSNIFYISAESVKELIVLVRNNKLRFKQWKTQIQLIEAIELEFGIRILPIKKEHLLTYARLTINEAQDHRDPSDHIIISQAITERMPLISSDSKFHFYTTQALDFVFNER
ncbi:MAG: type II toxin-antitoxin system VapC family toxin [Paludibacter sp.]